MKRPVQLLVLALVAALALSACSGGDEATSGGQAVTPSAPLGASMPATAEAALPVPAPSGSTGSQVSNADAKACYLGYIVIQSYWGMLVKAAKADQSVTLDANNARGLQAILVKEATLQPDDPDLAALAQSLRKTARSLDGTTVTPRQARAIGRDLVGVRRWCTAHGMDQPWFDAAQGGSSS